MQADRIRQNMRRNQIPVHHIRRLGRRHRLDRPRLRRLLETTNSELHCILIQLTPPRSGISDIVILSDILHLSKQLKRFSPYEYLFSEMLHTLKCTQLPS